MELVGVAFYAMLFGAAFGFHQALNWDFITILLAMGAMVPGAAIVTDRLLYPRTKMLWEQDKKFTFIFLLVVTIVAYMAYADGKSEFRKADHPISHFSSLWWIVYPYCCGGLVMLDRVFNAFKNRPQPDPNVPRPAREPEWLKVSEKELGANEKEAHETENVIKFDPKRFQ